GEGGREAVPRQLPERRADRRVSRARAHARPLPAAAAERAPARRGEPHRGAPMTADVLTLRNGAAAPRDRVPLLDLEAFRRLVIEAPARNRPVSALFGLPP